MVAGLAGGFVVWLYALLLPTLRQTAGGGQVAPLKPYLPAPLAELDPVGQGFVVGILINTLLLVGVSLIVRARGVGRRAGRCLRARRRARAAAAPGAGRCHAHR